LYCSGHSNNFLLINYEFHKNDNKTHYRLTFIT
jgi:hypothetical protein